MKTKEEEMLEIKFQQMAMKSFKILFAIIVSAAIFQAIGFEWAKRIGESLITLSWAGLVALNATFYFKNRTELIKTRESNDKVLKNLEVFRKL